jgi:CBS domain-containing protein
MKTVKDIISGKGSVFSIGPEATVFSAIKDMANKNVGALLVMDGDNLLGVLTERDYTRKVILEGKSSGNTLVKEIMNSEFLVVKPSTTIEECMALMIQNATRYLPVIENGRVVGIVSMGSVVNSIITEQNFAIDNLQKYIMQG